MTKPPTCVMTVKLSMMELLTEAINGVLEREEAARENVAFLSEDDAGMEVAMIEV